MYFTGLKPQTSEFITAILDLAHAEGIEMLNYEDAKARGCHFSHSTFCKVRRNWAAARGLKIPMGNQTGEPRHIPTIKHHEAVEALDGIESLEDRAAAVKADTLAQPLSPKGGKKRANRGRCRKAAEINKADGHPISRPEDQMTVSQRAIRDHKRAWKGVQEWAIRRSPTRY